MNCLRFPKFLELQLLILKASPCDVKYKQAIYVDQEVSWKFWTKRIKIDLIKDLFEKVPKPGAVIIRTLRETLHELFPKLLGYGKLFEISKGDAYQSNFRKSCKRPPEQFQDCVYYSLLARLEQEIKIRKNSVSDDENSAI